MSIPIPEPVVMTVNYNIVSFYYHFVNLSLFNGANVRISLYDDKGVVQKEVAYIIQGDEYKNWGGDDQYIVDLIIDKIPGWVNPPPTPTPDPTPVDPTPTDPTSPTNV
jgi:hypothetical protein